jgi:hypothetical protein
MYALDHGHAEQEPLVEPVQAKETANAELIEGKPQCILPNDPYLLL